MKSPIGTRQPLQPIMLEKGLTAYRCHESGGHYIPLNSYMKWLGEQPARLPQIPAPQDIDPEIQSQPQAYLCPETDTIMSRYKVGHGFPFMIERSITGGIWLDAGEWEALKERNFHDEIHFVFTAPWQQKVLQDQIKRSTDARFEDRLGKELFARLKELKAELSSNQDRSLALAYLMNE